MGSCTSILPRSWRRARRTPLKVKSRLKFAPRCELLEDRLTPSGFSLGDAANYGVLFEGHGGNVLSETNSILTGNLGIGGISPQGTWKIVGPDASKFTTVTGNVDFAGPSANITGTAFYSIAGG